MLRYNGIYKTSLEFRMFLRQISVIIMEVHNLCLCVLFRFVLIELIKNCLYVSLTQNVEEMLSVLK
jgi:hypothetical protein